MDCDRCRSFLPLVPGGELDPADAAAVLAHVDGCPACRKEGERYLFLDGILGSMREMDDIECNWERLAARTRARVFGTETAPAAAPARLFRLRTAVAALLFIAGAGLVTAGLLRGPAAGTVPAATTAVTAAAPAERGVPLHPVSPAETGLFGPAAFIAEAPPAAGRREGLLVDGPRVPMDTGTRLGSLPRNPTDAGTWLGILVHDRPGGGVQVEEAVMGAPAHAAGLRTGDIITGCGGTALRDSRHLGAIVDAAGAGAVLELDILRPDGKRVIAVTAARRPLHL